MPATPIIGQGSSVKLRAPSLAVATGVAILALAAFVPNSSAQRDVVLLDPAEARAQLTRATRESQLAETRAQRLQRESEQAIEAADKAAREAAAIAARIQASEADIAAAQKKQVEEFGFDIIRFEGEDAEKWLAGARDAGWAGIAKINEEQAAKLRELFAKE